MRVKRDNVVVIWRMTRRSHRILELGVKVRQHEALDQLQELSIIWSPDRLFFATHCFLRRVMKHY